MALSLLFAEYNLYTLIFLLGSVLVIAAVPKIAAIIFTRYARKIIEPEIKFMFLLFFFLMFISKIGGGHAVLPVFILGLVLSSMLGKRKSLKRKVQVVAFGLVTPFFFIKGGLNVSLKDVYANLGIMAILFGIKIAAKIIGVYPFSHRYIRKESWFVTLLMSTGLTFGTISSIYGLQPAI